MKKIVNPKQIRLFDPFDNVLTPKTRKRLLDSWAGVFRHVILELMPVETISGHFDPAMGRPTKELYSIAGLLLIKEFMDWTKDEALNAYSFHMDIHYALNLEPVTHDISMRTLERYMNLFEKDDIAKTVMSEITVTLVDLLELNIDKQRLDSTHIFSDMASFGRTRLMGVAIKRFLTQLARHDSKAYGLLDEQLRKPYTHLTQTPPTMAIRGRVIRCKSAKPVIRKMRLSLLPVPCLKPLLNRIRQLQAKYSIAWKNPSFCRERCLQTHTIAVMKIFRPLLNVASSSSARFNAAASSIHDKQTGQTKTVMPSSTCSQCEFRKECPVEKCRDGYCLYHTAKQRRLAGRRREEATDVFRDRYRIRGGIEGTNSGLKRKTGLGRLRVRGQPAVFQAIYLKIAGWNILRASVCARMREIVWEKANMAAFWLAFVLLRASMMAGSVRINQRKQILVYVKWFEGFSKLSKAA